MNKASLCFVHEDKALNRRFVRGCKYKSFYKSLPLLANTGQVLLAFECTYGFAPTVHSKALLQPESEALFTKICTCKKLLLALFLVLQAITKLTKRSFVLALFTCPVLAIS